MKATYSKNKTNNQTQKQNSRERKSHLSMQYKPQDSIKHRSSAKPPPAAGGPTPMRHRRISGRDLPGTGSKGLATVLYGINEGSCGLSTVDKLRRQQMIKEILIRRALSPPPRRFTLRWKNFRPTPSRLSTMSTA